MVNLHDFKLCHLHYQSTIFNNVILVHNVFLHYLSTVLPFPCILLVSYHFNFLCCSGHIHIEKKNHEKGRRGDWNFSAVMIKHTPFSCQERRRDITFHSASIPTKNTAWIRKTQTRVPNFTLSTRFFKVLDFRMTM